MWPEILLRPMVKTLTFWIKPRRERGKLEVNHY
jgi:hypothetical protein